MFIHFNLPCNMETQKRLHRTFRHKIREWKESGVVDRAVLTYHFGVPDTTDSLFVCLDIPTVEEATKQKVEVSQKTKKQIPSLIMQYFNYICRENHIILRIINYKSDIEREKKKHEQNGIPYYNGSPVEEILRFASAGTKIAFKVLDQLEKDEKTWNRDIELSQFIFSRLRGELGADYKWMKKALHFVCNPLLIPEYSVTFPLGNRALEAIKIDP